MIPIPEFERTGQFILWLLITAIMPLAVGLVTKVSTPSYWKVALLLALSLLNGILTTWLDDFGAFDWRRAIGAAVMAWIVAVASHFGVWKPTNATARAQNSLIKDDYTLAR